MRKFIGKLLALVLFVSAFQGINPTLLQAADNNIYEFDVLKEILAEDNQGLVRAKRTINDEETALVKWNISSAAKYKLTYYIEDKLGVTKRVEINLDNQGDDNVILDAQIFTGSDIAAENLDYVPREFDASTNSWRNGTKITGVTNINASLKIGSEYAREYHEFNANVTSVNIGGKNFSFRVKIDGEQVYIFTNGLLKGNVSKFELTTDTTPPGEVEARREFFNGLKNFTITPVHLEEGGGLVSTNLISDLKTQTPGSRPGIKVSFDQIKILKGKEFKAATATDTIGDVMLKLQPQYSITGSVQDGDDSIRLDFTPVAGKTIKINEVESGKPVLVDDGKINIYLASTLDGALTLDANVIGWDILDSSMVLDSMITYAGTAESYKPENKGHTYLQYSLNRTTNNEVQFTIQPYNINSNAIYTIYSSSTYDPSNPNNGFSEKVTYQYDPNKTANQEITAAVASTNTTYFKVDVEIDGRTYTSQVVKYIPSLFNVTPTTPSIKTIDNIYVVPSDENSSHASPLAIGFDIEWYAPNNVKTLLNGGTLYYEMLVRKNKEDVDPLKTPTMAGKEGFAAYSKVFKVYLDANGKVVVEADLGTAGQAESEAENKLIRYNESKGTFKMESVSLMNFSKTSTNWEQITVPSSYIYSTATTHFSGVAGTSVNDDLMNMTIPGYYYISLRTVYVSKDNTKVISYSNESNLEPIALDITKEIIPVPKTVLFVDNSTDKSNITEKISFSYVDIQNYVKQMIEPAMLRLYENGHPEERYSGDYEFYLCQDPNALQALIRESSTGLDQLEPIEVSQGATFTLSESQLQTLKTGGVIPIKVHISSLIGVGEGEINIAGVNPNTVYYLQLRTKLSPISDTEEVEPRFSMLSRTFSFTTSTEPMPPSSEDKVPPAPERIWIEEQKNNSSVKLGWAPAAFEEDKDIQKTYYEFIRTDAQLTQEQQKLNVESLVSSDATRVGFRSDIEGPRGENEPAYISTYTHANQTWTKLTPEQLSSEFRLYDDSLNPNHVYYYYVRTVCVVNGVLVKSKWIMVPVTTSPVLPPINLKVEAPKTYSHDTKNEIVISFDAPIPEGAGIPRDFDFNIAVKSELDDEYRLDYPVSRLTSNQVDSLTPEGYTHFVYKITDLKSNKRYDIKVRIIDKTQAVLEDGNYPASLYSDKVTTRTDYDEGEAEEDSKYAEYLKKFDQAVEKLRRKPYWVVEEDSSYKYRESYLMTELGLLKEYNLVSNEDTNSLYYYLPAAAFVNDNNTSTVLNITIGTNTMSIRPYTLTSENEEIKEAVKKIADNGIEDYYVGITFDVQKTSEMINGQRALSPKLGIDMELVYMKQQERLTEDDIMIALNKIIDSERKSFITQLEKKIDKGVIADDVLQDLIDEAIKDIEEDHAKQVSKIMKRQIKDTVSVSEIEKNILLTSQTDAFLVEAYYYNRGWSPIESYQIGDRFGIEADKLGVYIFTGQADLISTVPSLAPYQSFIGKYNLTDFFKLDSYWIKTAVSKEQLYGAAARVLGAKRGVDYTNYLKNAGIKGITGIGLSKNVRQDEAIYIIMQVYEKNRNRSVGSISIRNRQSVQNIGAFQSIYRTYVYAAVELKIVDNPNSKVLPSKEMTAEEIIKILYKMQAQ